MRKISTKTPSKKRPEMLRALALGRFAGGRSQAVGAALTWEAHCELSWGSGSAAGTCYALCLLMSSCLSMLAMFPCVRWHVAASGPSPARRWLQCREVCATKKFVLPRSFLNST